MLPKDDVFREADKKDTLLANEAKAIADTTKIPGDYHANMLIEKIDEEVLGIIRYGGYSSSTYSKYKPKESLQAVRKYYESKGYKVNIRDEFIDLDWSYIAITQDI